MKVQQLFLLVGITLLLTACGKKGPVRPLDIPVPGPVRNVELRQQGENLLLGWQLPKENLDGSPLAQAPQLDIFRQTFDPADDCPECIDRSALLVSINPELPQPARQVADRYLLVDRELEAGKGYQYRLVPRTAAGDVGQPVIVRQSIHQPVAAPEQLLAIARDRSVSLSWQPIIPAEGETLLGYQLYRRLSGAASPPYPLNAVPLQETRFEDFNLENGVPYFYRIRALVKRGDQTLEGLASPEVEAIPKPGI